MPHLLASVAGQDSASRTESAPRRGPRDVAPHGDDAFSAILDRTTALRGETARARVAEDNSPVDASEAPEVSATHGLTLRSVDGRLGPQRQKPQQDHHQQPGRANRQGDDTAPQAAPEPTPGQTAAADAAQMAGQSNSTPPADASTNSSASQDAPMQGVAAPDLTLGAAAPAADGATIAIAPLPTAPQLTITGAASSTLPAGGAIPVGPMPLPDLPGEATPPAGPTPPGAPQGEAMPPAQTGPVPTVPAPPGNAGAAPATATAEPAARPPSAEPRRSIPLDAPAAAPPATTATVTAPGGQQQAPSTEQAVSATPAPESSTPAKPEAVLIASASPPQGNNARPAPRSDKAATPAMPGSAVAIVTEAPIEAGQPQVRATSEASVPPAPGAGPAPEPASNAPALPATARQPTPPSDDASPGTRHGATRNASPPNAAFTAQLAQQDPAAQAAVASPAVASTFALPNEAPRVVVDHGGARSEFAADEIAPVRHAIALPQEAGSGPPRVEANSDTAATRTARTPMHPAIAQVAVTVTKAVQEGVDRITIKLQPPELGRIDVRLEVGIDGRIQAVFAAERPATVEILQRDVRELERALQSAGLSTDAGGLSFGLKQNGGQNGSAFAAFQRDPGSGRGPTGEEDAPPVQRPLRAAADGRLDIHV